MLTDDELRPDQVAVVVPGLPHPEGFPWPEGWRPSAPLLLLAERRPGGDGPRFRLQHRHRAEDAATADIRPAVLGPAGGRDPTPVILKLQRVEAAFNARRDAIEARLNREQRILRDLADGLPDDRKADVPRTLQPDGAPRTAREALRVRSPMVLCLAARHAIDLGDGLGDREDHARQALRARVGRDLSACGECPNRRSSPPGPEDDPIPPACRPWIVAHQDTGRPGGLILPQVRLLILTDMGVSLQKHLEDRLAAHAGAQAAEGPEEVFRSKLNLILELARTLAATHRRGWLHLDLNLDNLCLDEGSPDRSRLIDFGHAEPRDASTDMFRDRIPLRRLDFAASEMQLRSYPLRVRRVGDAEWEAFGLAGWPREWWPAAGDLLELTEGHERPVFLVHLTRSSRNRLRLTVRPMDGADRAGPPDDRILDSTVHRSPAPSADLCSFGLIALCWLTNVQRPVLFRNELAVFERSISSDNRLDASPVDGAVTDDNWLATYRRVFGRYCVLLEETIPWWQGVLKRSALSPGRAAALESAFIQCVRMAIKCVVRHPRWSYAADTSEESTPFDRVAEDLAGLCESLGSGAMPTPRYPKSFDHFFQWVSHALPIAPTPDERRQDATRLHHLDDALATAWEAGDALVEVRRSIHAAEDDLSSLWRRVDGVEGYYQTFRQTSWFRRHVWARVMSLLTGGYRGGDADQLVVGLARDVERLAGHAWGSDQDLMRDLAVALTAISASFPELAYHLRRTLFSRNERRRVDTIVEEWRSISRRLAPTLARMATSETIEHERVRRQLLELGGSFRDLRAVFHKRHLALVARGREADDAAEAVLESVLEELRRPARVILLFARIRHKKLLKITASCMRLSNAMASRLEEQTGTGIAIETSLTKYRRAVDRVKAEILTLIKLEDWGQ